MLSLAKGVIPLVYILSDVHGHYDKYRAMLADCRTRRVDCKWGRSNPPGTEVAGSGHTGRNSVVAVSAVRWGVSAWKQWKNFMFKEDIAQ